MCLLKTKWILLFLFPAVLLAQPEEAPADGGTSEAATEPAVRVVVDTEQTAKEGQKIVDLYDAAVAETERVCEKYREIKAMELARIRGMPYGEAYEAIQSVMPELRPIDRELLSKGLRDPSDIEPHKAELERVKAEVEAMIELTERLLLEIEKVQIDFTPLAVVEQQKTLEDIVAQEKFDPDAEREIEAQELAEIRETQDALMQEMEETARQDQEETPKDMTELMVQFQNVKDTTTEEQSDDGEMRELFTSDDSLTDFQTLHRRVDNALLARSIQADGEPRKWLVVDTWYIIGPFPNPFRSNLNKQFPPETIVDLDATYPGKDGRLVHWEWVQSRDPLVVPTNSEEYGIWYAYTELYFDQPMDLWVAIGSDDKTNIWVNEMPIWTSGDQLKGWRINEGLRKVHFNEGYNEVLVRLENGWIDTGFSFIIHAAP